MRYRPDIDGLRALAVVPILFEHAKLNGFAGGFVGVDVFFVVSGFLISRIISTEVGNNTFSLSEFLARRARRILPALVLVVVACAVAGYFTMMPSDFKRLGASIASASLFVSNIFFWRQGSYFGAPMREMPLLHTWSLAIEEQFYVALPLLFIAAHRFAISRRNLLRMVAIAALASCALGCVTVFFKASATFYLLPTRAWELLLGVTLGLSRDAAAFSAVQRRALSITGLALVVGPVFLFTKATLFPGLAALPPTLGTALVILAADRTNPLLTNRVSTQIGKMSYSLYLWHFPLLAFAAYLWPYPMPAAVSACMLGLIFLISYSSWYFVEVPARRASITAPRLLAGAGAVTVAMLALGLGMRIADVTSSQLTRAQLAYDAERPSTRDYCFLGPSDAIDERRCPLGASRQGGVAPTFALLGDSHAEALVEGLHVAAQKAGLGGFYLGMPGCPPVLGLTLRGSEPCASDFTRIMAKVLSMPHVDTVILHARWAVWVNGDGYRWENLTAIPFQLRLQDRPFDDNAAAIAIGLRRTVEAIRSTGRTAWIVGPVPEVGLDVPKFLFLKSRGMPLDDVAPTTTEFLARAEKPLREFGDMENSGAARIFLPHLTLCPRARCLIEHNGRALYMDDDHLSLSGARFLADALRNDILSKPVASADLEDR